MPASAKVRNATRRVIEQSDAVLDQTQASQRAAIVAIRKFIDRLDDAVPAIVDDRELRKLVVHAVADYYEDLSMTTTGFVVGLVRRTTATLSERTAPDQTKTSASRPHNDY